MKEIHLKLTVDEVNLIFEILGQQPFTKVFELIGKINEQADHQLSTDGHTDSEQNADPKNE